MTRGLRGPLLGSVAAGMLPFLGLAAHAQTQQAPQTQRQTTAAAQTPLATSVAEVLVTAEKRSQLLTNVAASVSVVPGARLEQIGAVDLADWAPFVPGLQVDNFGAPGLSFLSMDGIGPIGAASEVGVYVGEVPIGSSSSFQGADAFTMDLLPYDLDRVEVLRGPQGTLYGASTMGGLIKYVLDAPNLEQFSGRIGADVFGVSNADSAGGGVRGEINAPIVTDKLALRVSGYDENTPGYISDPVLGVKDDNALAQYGGRASLLWRPTDDVSVQLEAIYQHTHADNQALAALDITTDQPIYGALDNINSRPEPYTQDFQLYDAVINWDLHFATLTSVSSYQQFANDTVEDLTPYLGVYLGLLGLSSGPGQAQFNENYTLKKVTQEFRLASPSGNRLEWLVGAYYTYETGTNYEVFIPYNAQGVLLSAVNPVEFANLPSTYQEYAFFGNATYHFNRWFDLSAGLRWAQNDQTFLETEGGALLGSVPTTAVKLTVPGASSQSVPTWQVSPELHFTPQTMGYLRVATGYQPGGPNVVLPGVKGLPATYDASTLIDYQLGVKSTLWGGRATLDASAFLIDWTDIQVSVFIGDETALENAGAARSQGFDLSGTVSPLPGLTFGGALSYADAVLTKPIPSLDVLSGARLPYVPLWSGSLTAEYSRPIAGPWTGFVGGGWRYVDSRYSFPEGATANGEPDGPEAAAYNDLDLHLGGRTHDLTPELFAKNVLDTRAFLAPQENFFSILGAPIDVKAPVLQPATFGLRVEKSF